MKKYNLKKRQDFNELNYEVFKYEPRAFLLTCIFTYDPDSKEKIRPFPDYDYIWFWLDVWLNEQYILVLKSRQIMATWTFLAFHFWKSCFYPGTFCILQSSKESKAGWGGTKSATDPSALLSRVKFFYEHLPEFIQNHWEISCAFQDPMIVLKNKKEGGESILKAISSKEYDFRGFPKGIYILADELAFQPEAHQAFVSAQPLIGKEGKYTAITTAANNQFLLSLMYGKER